MRNDTSDVDLRAGSDPAGEVVANRRRHGRAKSTAFPFR
jgi:hypothetical protein